MAILIALAAALPATRADAQSYSCEVEGHKYGGDEPPPQCRGRYRELNPDGSIKRLFEPPPTREEQDKVERQKRAQDLELQARQERRRRDLALLAAYASEAEIVAARDSALVAPQSLVEGAESALGDLLKERGKLDNEAEFYARRGLPPQLKRQLEVNEDLQGRERKIIADFRTDVQRTSERFEADRKRFHELMLSGATPGRSTADAAPAPR